MSESQSLAVYPNIELNRWGNQTEGEQTDSRQDHVSDDEKSPDVDTVPLGACRFDLSG